MAANIQIDRAALLMVASETSKQTPYSVPEAALPAQTRPSQQEAFKFI
jgi:hypothetical protein